jgi:hypothetical protein
MLLSMNRMIVLLAVSGLLNQSAFAADEVRLKWSELGALVTGHEVAFSTAGGTNLRGDARVVRDDALLIHISSTSDSKLFPKGETSVPRDQISMVDVKKIRGAGGRTIGTTAGLLGGLTASGEIIGHSNMSEGPAIAVFLAASIGSAVAGYFVGKAHDRRVTRIRIVP